MTTHLLNSAMMPVEGDYSLRSVSREVWGAEAATALQLGTARSSIGYPETAAVLSALCGRSIPVSRDLTTPEDGDILLIARLPYRVAVPGTKGEKVALKAEDLSYFRAEYRTVRP